MYVFCGDHGVTEEGISLYPSVVTREYGKEKFRSRRRSHQCDLPPAWDYDFHRGFRRCRPEELEGVIDRRIAEGTANFRRGAAMTREQAARALESGIELGRDAAGKFDLAGVGEMGIGNTTAASALLCVFTGATPEEAVGRGTGLDDAGLAHKRKVLTEALAVHHCDLADPLGVVAAVGGFEIAMMAGFLLGAAARRLPVVMDGFISGAAFLIAQAFAPTVAYCVFFGHRSAEHGHARMLTNRHAPMLDLGMRLGEGTGAALAMGLLTSGVALYREMATFAEAAVSDTERIAK